MLGSATALVLAGSGIALAQSFGGNGAPFLASGGAGGGFGQNGANGTGSGGGGGGGPGGTLGGAAGNGTAGGGGTGGANGATAATINAGNFTGAIGGDATNPAALNGGGGGSGGYGYAVTAAGTFSTAAGQIFTGGNGGAGNGMTNAGIGGSGGGGLVLLQGGTFTNVAGASLIGGAGGATPSITNVFLVFNGGDGLTTSNYIGGPASAATVTNAGTITAGAGGTLVATPGAPAGSTNAFSYGGGTGLNFLGGGSVTNTTTGVITGGVGGAGFGGTATLGPGNAGFSGLGLGSSGGGLVTNNGQVTGGAGVGGTVQTVGSRPGVEFSNAQNSYAGGSGGLGLSNDGTALAPGSIVNNATGIIAGGRGGDGTSGTVNAVSPHAAAGAGGFGGGGVAMTSGSLLNFGQILGGAAGKGANATVAGQVGGSDPFNVGGIGVSLNGVFFQSTTMSLDNRGAITGGAGSTPGTSGAGAAGAKGGDGGAGVDAVKPVTGTLTIVNSGQITGGNGAAGSAGAPNGANGLGGAGIQIRGDGTITTSGAISGGLNGDGTRANAITLLSGVHTLTLQTGATFNGNLVVDTAAASNPGVAANNTLNLDGAGTGAVSSQIHNFGHLTQTSGTGGTWTLNGASTFTVDATISAGTLVLGTGAVLTSPNVNLLTGGTLSLSSATLAGDTLNINGGTLRVTGTTLTSLANPINFGANRGAFDIAAAANTFTLSQSFSGGGALTKLGAGTLALTGANTYTGGTTISAGALVLGNGGTTGSIVGNVANSGVFGINRSNALTYAGVISGAGSFQQLGSGTTTFTGANTYTGATEVKVGTLRGGAVNVLSNVTAMTVAAGATFDAANFDQRVGSLAGAGSVTLGTAALTTGGNNTSTDFSGVISGSNPPLGGAALTKNGTGTQTLSGVNTYTGATTVNAGTLSVNGSIASSLLTTVNAGGTLGGNGILGNTTINGGTLAPGNSIGLLTVQGNLVFTAASSYMVEVSPANADRTNVTGTATLGGATVSANFAAGTYVAKQYTIVNATGGVIGTFNGPVNTNLPGGFKSSLSYNGNNAFLDLALDFTPTPTPTPTPNSGLNVNQTNVANALTGFFNRTGGIPLVFGSLTPTGLTIASGELPTASQQATFDAMGTFVGLLTDPFVGGRGDPVTAGASAAQFTDESQAANAYASNGKPRSKDERDAYAAIYRKAPPMAPFVPSWSVWAAGYGGSQTTDGNTALGSNNTRSSIGGVAVGADYRFSPNTLAGFAVAGGGTNFSVNGLGTGRSDLFQAGAFVRHTVGPAYIAAALAYGWQDITTDRTVTIAGTDVLRAKFNANAFSGRAEGGYRFVTPWMAMGITPYAAGQFTTFELPAYAEQVIAGANTFALSYAAKDVTASRSELGLRSDKSFAMQNGIFTLRGRAAWAHNFNTDRNVSATFQTLPGASFVVNGARQASDSALVTGSAEMKWLNGFSLAGTFEGEFSNVTTSYAGKGVVRYAW